MCDNQISSSFVQIQALRNRWSRQALSSSHVRVFALSAPGQLIACDLSDPTMKVGERITEVPGLKNRIDWRVGIICDLPLKSCGEKVSYCAEVPEQINKKNAALRRLSGISIL